jgi:hypothetical protein
MQANSLNQHIHGERDVVSVNSSTCIKVSHFSNASPGATPSEMCSTSAEYHINHKTQDIESQTCSKTSQCLSVTQQANNVGSSESCEKARQYSTAVSQQIEMIKPQTLQVLNVENKNT